MYIVQDVCTHAYEQVMSLNFVYYISMQDLGVDLVPPTCERVCVSVLASGSVCMLGCVSVCLCFCVITCFLNVVSHSFHISLCDLVDTDGLGVWEWSQDTGQQPHPLIPISTR